jgi:hypothetical protein
MEEKVVVVLMSSHVGVTTNDVSVSVVVGFPINSVALVRQFPGGSIKTNNKCA